MGHAGSEEEKSRVTEILLRSATGFDRVQVDLVSLRQALEGATPTPRDSTMLSVIRNEYQAIASARKRGLHWREIADLMTDSGVPVTPELLRKYASRIGREGSARKERKSK